MRIAFVIADGERGTALIVDSGADPGPRGRDRGVGREVAAILRTHAHHNHVIPKDELRERYGVEVIAMNAVGIPEPQGMRSRSPGGDHVRRRAQLAADDAPAHLSPPAIAERGR